MSSLTDLVAGIALQNEPRDAASCDGAGVVAFQRPIKALLALDPLALWARLVAAKELQQQQQQQQQQQRQQQQQQQQQHATSC